MTRKKEPLEALILTRLGSPGFLTISKVSDAPGE